MKFNDTVLYNSDARETKNSIVPMGKEYVKLWLSSVM
jgi:hypothetical protein